MEIELAQVAVILKALEVPLRVDSKDDRIAMQKAIYLTQVKARDLGYRFSWYRNGPYSTELADVYYKAAAQKHDYEQYNADLETIHALNPVCTVIKAKPSNSSLSAWLEALASLDYMKRLYRKSPDKALEACRRQKPHLDHLFDAANAALTRNHFA